MNDAESHAVIDGWQYYYYYYHYYYYYCYYHHNAVHALVCSFPVTLCSKTGGGFTSRSTRQRRREKTRRALGGKVCRPAYVVCLPTVALLPDSCLCELRVHVGFVVSPACVALAWRCASDGAPREASLGLKRVLTPTFLRRFSLPIESSIPTLHDVFHRIEV